jgi:hypothetical protein
MGVFGSGNKKSTTDSSSDQRQYQTEDEIYATDYGANSKVGTADVTLGKGASLVQNTTMLDGGAIDSAFAFSTAANVAAADMAKDVYGEAADLGASIFGDATSLAKSTYTDATAFGENLFEGAMSFGSDALNMSESVTNKNIDAAVDLATASMDTLRTLTADALEGAAQSSQRETETAMFALQKANVISGDIDTSKLSKYVGYVVVAIAALYFLNKRG